MITLAKTAKELPEVIPKKQHLLYCAYPFSAYEDLVRHALTNSIITMLFSFKVFLTYKFYSWKRS